MLLQDIWGVEVEGEQIGTLYFDGRKLKEWTMPQKLDKYEKIRIVGKGKGNQYTFMCNTNPFTRPIVTSNDCLL